MFEGTKLPNKIWNLWYQTMQINWKFVDRKWSSPFCLGNCYLYHTFFCPSSLHLPWNIFYMLKDAFYICVKSPLQFQKVVVQTASCLTCKLRELIYLLSPLVKPHVAKMTLVYVNDKWGWVSHVIHRHNDTIFRVI